MKKEKRQFDIAQRGLARSNLDICNMASGSTPPRATKITPFTTEKDPFLDIQNQVRQASAAMINTTSKYPYSKARLIEGKRWYVAFSAWDVNKEKLVYKRLYDPLNRGTKSKMERRMIADQMIRDINAALIDGKFLGKYDQLQTNSTKNLHKLSLLDCIQFVIDQKKSTNHRKNYIHDFTRLKNNLAKWIEDVGIDDMPIKKFTEDDAFSFLQWMATKKMGNKTINNYRSDLSIAFNFLLKKSPTLFVRNPVRATDPLPVTTKMHTALSDEQMKQVVTYCQQNGLAQLLLFIRMIYYTFGRPESEILKLRVDDIDLQNNRVLYRGEISKTKFDAYVSFPLAMAEALATMNLKKYPPHFYLFGRKGEPGDKPMGYDIFYRQIRTMFTALHFYKTGRKYTVYCFKHSGGIALYLATKDMELVQRQCRHTDIKQTGNYLRDLGIMRNDNGLEKWKGVA
jgi:integrase